MKKLILTTIFSLMSIFSFAETTIDNVYIETPCKVVYTIADTTFVNIRNDEYNNVYYEVKDNNIYIKSKSNLDNEIITNIPVIRIVMNTKETPNISVSRSLYIAEKKTIINNEKSKK